MNKKDQSTFNQLYSDVVKCTQCPLHETRINAVFGEGDINAEILIIGEGPGANEDKQGRPFVGRAGKLLDEVLGNYGLSREKGVFIANIVKCRPPQNRVPKKSEVNTCFPYLEKQIELLNPKIILLLGLTAVKSFLGIEEQMKTIRGVENSKDGRKVMATYHPAAILRNPNLRDLLEEDINKIAILTKNPG
jgi:DNA polymerase